MLQAIHLLLAGAGQDTPVIVLLAVDPRIVEAAVEDSFGSSLRKEVLRSVKFAIGFPSPEVHANIC